MPKKDIESCCQELQDKWPQIKSLYFKSVPGYYLDITCSYRSPEEQMELFKIGRTMGKDGKWVISQPEFVVTNCDGTHNPSNHNKQPSHAIDVVAINNKTGKATWEDKYYLPLGQICELLGLVWGGSFGTIHDLPHIETKNG